GNDPATVKANRKTAPTQEHALDRLARETGWSVFGNRRRRLYWFPPVCLPCGSWWSPKSRARSRRRTRRSRNGLGDEPHFVDRGAPEGSSHRAGRCVPYHATVPSTTCPTPSPPHT